MKLARVLPALLLFWNVAAPAADGPVPPEEAAGRMTLPQGFSATLFAAEPDVRQPIAFTIDPRGRLWVAECYSYPSWIGGPQGRDRILILEDTDGDGRHDRRTVFWDKGSNVTGLALGFGGVWVCATPNLLFIPDRDGDDIPDGEPEVKLDGWDLKAEHNMFNALNWGPDGWLWGGNGIMSNSKVGRPGTPNGDRTPINCGIWRYHPTREVFEVVSHGTTNPWGLDFDDYGSAFLTNCVIPHLFQVVPGAHHQRMFGQDMNPFSYELMTSCADHIHWAGGNWTDSRGGQGKHGEAGGGHAHVGAMIYLGDNWPDEYRNSVFTANLHGHRVNNDTLERSGSGYVARHAKDFLFANDDWFRGLELKYGPDGAVYLTDWSDMGECHDTDADNAHRENGRIYKIAYGKPRPVSVDLANLPDADLVSLQSHKNDWYVRTARRLLQERATSGRPMGDVHEALRASFGSETSAPKRLRMLWSLYVTGGLDEPALRDLLNDRDENVRAWSVRLLGDSAEPGPEALATMAAMSARDGSPLVRLALASALQRIAPVRRWPLAEGLVSHVEDAGDATLPLMIWYGVEPLGGIDQTRAVSLTVAAKIPTVRRLLARRVVASDDEVAADRGAHDGLAAVVRGLAEATDADTRNDMIDGIREALRGRKELPAPADWPRVAASLWEDRDAGVRLRALLLGLQFGDERSRPELISLMSDANNGVEVREAAMQALVEARAPGLASHLLDQLDDPALRRPALRALAAAPDARVPAILVKSYASFDPADREDAITTLAARPESANALLDAIADGSIPKRDLNATTARQILAFGKPELTTRLGEVWGSLRPTSADKVALLARYKAVLESGDGKAVDPSRGRAVFNRSCVQCHRLYDAGGDVGPELTGSDRANSVYILENVLDPGATVGKDYRLVTAATADGRLLSGIVREQTDKTVTIQTVNERVVLPREEIDEYKESSLSMMPEGLLEKLTDDEVRDLLAYLATKAQVPIP